MRSSYDQYMCRFTWTLSPFLGVGVGGGGGGVFFVCSSFLVFVFLLLVKLFIHKQSIHHLVHGEQIKWTFLM